MKAKVDTGARTSAIHAHDVERFRRRGREWVRFRIYPLQRKREQVVVAEAELLDQRTVRSSSGHAANRFVIVTLAELFEKRWPIEITLTNRDEMGFRMLLGREAIRGCFLVDPGRSYLAGKRE